MPISSQIAGNCSWANVQAVIPVAYALLTMDTPENLDYRQAMRLYNDWVEWDKDRALDECLQRFNWASPARKASIAAMLGGILFQTCDHDHVHHVERAEKILAVLTLPEYSYVLQSYLDEYCVRRLTHRGNNL